MAIKKFRLFLLLIVLPAVLFMLATGLQKYQYAPVTHNSGADFSATATCTGSTNCKACKNCDYCKHCKQEKGTCGVCSR